MAQKLNPTSIRIGQYSPWIITYQTYGKSLYYFSYYHFFFLFSFFFTFFNFFSTLSNIFLLDNKIYLFVNTSTTKSNHAKLRFGLKKIKRWPRITNQPKFRFFPVSNILNLASSISFYFQFLFFKKIIFRKIILILAKLLRQQIGTTKLVFLKFGLKKVKLKGFKLKLTGRFENTKNQMAKKVEYAEGSLSLLPVNSVIEFFTLNIYSKLGVCNFKIWLFYY